MCLKRAFDLIASGIGLLILAPILIIVAAAIKLDSRGSVFFRQERVGQHGVNFRIYKFRTMEVNAEQRGMQITVGNDARVTRVGRILRKYKLDELAQLIDVFRGKMSLVGPRPEVPKYVALYPDDVRDTVLSVKPGITDRASIEYKDEASVLASAVDPHEAYVKDVLPVKLAYYTSYVRERSFLGDIAIIFATIFAILR